MQRETISQVYRYNNHKSGHFRCLTLTIMGLVPGALFGVFELGNYGAVAVDVETGVKYSSNITLNSMELDDFIFNFQPLLRYRFDEGTVHVDAFAGVNILRYDDYDGNDAEDVKSQIVIKFPSGDYGNQTRYDLRLDAGYNESTSPNDSVQAIAAVEKINFSLIGRYYISERTFVRSGFVYLDRQSQTMGFDDIMEISVPIEFFYDYSEDLSYGIGYRYKVTDLDGTIPEADSEDHAVFIAVVGQVAPSVTAEVRVGGQQREFDQSVYDTETGFFMESGLLWQVSDLTRIDLSVGNEFNTTIANQSKETFFAEIGIQHQFSDKITASAGLGYQDVEYTILGGMRDDEQWSAQLGGVYTLIEDRLEVAGSLKYADRSSSLATATYDVFTAGISISYLF